MPQPADKCLLCLSADPLVARVLKEHAEGFGLDCQAAASRDEALSMVRRTAWRAVVVDDPDATDTIALAKAIDEARPGQPIAAFWTGRAERMLTRAVLGDLLVGLLPKPWTIDELEILVHRADAQVRKAAQLESFQRNLPPSASAPLSGGTDVPGFGPILELSLGALDAFSPNLSAGARRARALCETLAQLGAVNAELGRPLVIASVLHDFTLLRRDRRQVCRWLISPALCAPDQREDLQRHPAEVASMLRGIPGLDAVADICLHHGEQFDGSGYPARLQGEMIPWPARLLSAANYFAFQFGRDADVLRRMETSDAALFDPEAIRAIKTALPLTKLPRLVRELATNDLRAGMELAREIRNHNQEVLLPRGHVLSETEIRRLVLINADVSKPAPVLVMS